MGALGDALQEVRYRTRTGGVPLPAVLLGLLDGTAADARRAAETIAQGAAGTPHAHLQPHSRTEPAGGLVPEVAETAELLREASREISESGRLRGEPPIRFPLLSVLLRLLPIPATSADPRTVRARLRQASEVIPGTELGDEHSEGVPELPRVARWHTYLEVVVPPAVTLLAVLSAALAQVVDVAVALAVAGIGAAIVLAQLVVVSRDWAGRWRFRWFTRQPFLRPHFGQRTGLARERFLDFAVHVVRAARRPEQAEQVELVLVHAFLEDLRRAYHRRLVRRAPWARTIRPLLLLSGVDPDDPRDRLLRHIDAVRTRTQEVDPLLVVAVGTEPPAPLASPAAGQDADSAVQRLNGIARQARVVEVFGPQRDVTVRLPAADAAAELTADQASPPPRRPRTAHPALPWAVMIAVILGSGGFVLSEQIRYCDARTVWRAAADGQCIGVTDGSFSFHDRLDSVTRLIKNQNDAVDAGDEPYVTVVYFGGMTPAEPNSGADLLGGIHGELAGVAAQQREHNSSTNLPKIKLLLASPGGRYVHAAPVADEVIRMAREDTSIVAVIGFDLSTAHTQMAIRRMAAAGLPMVSTVATLDRLPEVAPRRFSPYFFRLAPGNERIGRYAAEWALDGRLGRPGERPAPPAHTAVVFADGRSADLYSRDLGNQFARNFRQREGARVEVREYRATSDFGQELNEVCSSGPGGKTPDIIYYSGRSDEFLSFFKALEDSTCDTDEFTLLAGDDVTKYVNDNLDRLASSGVRFFYTPLALPQAGPRNDFGYLEVLRATGLSKRPPRMQPSRTHAAVGYDALLVVARAAQVTYTQQNRTEPRGGALLYPLSRREALFGVSGYISFGDRAGGHEAKDKAVLLVTVDGGGRLRLVAHCGRLDRDDGPGCTTP